MNRIVRAFDAASRAYDEASPVQRDVARALVLRASGQVKNKPENILDLGCGAGHATEFARAMWPGAEVSALDAAPNMLARLAQKFADVRIVCADARDFSGGPFDLVLTSMMLHWLENPREMLARWREMLIPGGLLCAAVPVEGSLGEWRAICRAENFADPVWGFPAPGFADDLCEARAEESFGRTYANARDFLRALKNIGGHVSPPGRRPENAAALRRLLKKYDAPFSASFRIEFLTLAARGGEPT